MISSIEVVRLFALVADAELLDDVGEAHDAEADGAVLRGWRSPPPSRDERVMSMRLSSWRTARRALSSIFAKSTAAVPRRR